MKNVLITGISGYLGGVLARRIAAEPEVETIIGLDVREPSSPLPKCTFVKHDITVPFGDIFTQYHIDTALHLAFIVAPMRDEAKARRINLEGSRNFLDAAAQAREAQVFYLGSHLEYGARRDNPSRITEDSPLRPNVDYPYAVEKVEVDRMFQQFADHNPEIIVTIGRTVAVAGPGAGASGLNILFLPVMVKVYGKNPDWQFVQEGDLAEWVVRLLRGRHSGIFNFAGDGSVLYRDIIEQLGKPSLTLPGWLLYNVIRLAWKLRLQTKGQAGGLAMLQYPILLSNEKVEMATGYQAACTSEQAFLSYLHQRIGKE